MAHNPIVLTHSIPGAQTVSAGKRTFILPGGTWRLRDVEARLGTAPTGAVFIIDVNKNGTSIFPNVNDRTVINSGVFASSPFGPRVERALRVATGCRLTSM